MNRLHLDKLKKEEIAILDEVDRICREDGLDYFLIGGTLLGAVRHKGFIPWDDDIDIAMPRNDFEKFINKSSKKLDARFELNYINTNKSYFKPFAKVTRRNTVFKEPYITKENNWGIWIDIFPLDDISESDKRIACKIKKHIKYCNSLLEKKYAYGFKECKTIRNKMVFFLSRLISSNFIIKRRESLMTKFNNKDNQFFINYGSRYSVEKQFHKKDKYYPIVQMQFEKRVYNVPNDPKYVLSKIYGSNFMELPPKEKRVTHDPLYIKFSDGDVFKGQK